MSGQNLNLISWYDRQVENLNFTRAHGYCSTLILSYSDNFGCRYHVIYINEYTWAMATARSRREHFLARGPASASDSSWDAVSPTCGRPFKMATVAGTAPLSRMMSSTPLSAVLCVALGGTGRAPQVRQKSKSGMQQLCTF